MSMWLIFIIFCSLSAPLAYHISILFSQTTEATQKKHDRNVTVVVLKILYDFYFIQKLKTWLIGL